MIDILIFGTGKCFRETVITLDFEKVRIIGLIDNDEKKQNTFINGYRVYAPKDIAHLNYNYIIIASQYHNEIFNQLIDLGVNFRNIVPVFYYQCSKSLIEDFKKRILEIKKIKINEKPKIGLLKQSNSGSNTFALYKNMPQYIKNKYNVELVDANDLHKDDNFDLICSTHLNYLNNLKTINVELWHGLPLKKVGLMNGESIQNYNKNNVELIISTSELYSTLFNASYPNISSKYEICGMPRNDFLFKKDKNLLSSFFDKDILQKKIIVNMPTFRRSSINEELLDSDQHRDNIFNFKDWKIEELAKYLRSNDIVIITKMHPTEKECVNKEEYIGYEDVFKFVDDDQLKNKNIDLYEILANIDMLITDYSSIYFDILLMDIPIVFTPTDIEQYEIRRGFNLTPYDFWTPGPKVYTMKELMKTINEWDNETFKYRRKQISDITNYYKDNNSCERTWKKIDKLLINKL